MFLCLAKISIPYSNKWGDGVFLFASSTPLHMLTTYIAISWGSANCGQKEPAISLYTTSSAHHHACYLRNEVVARTVVPSSYHQNTGRGMEKYLEIIIYKYSPSKRWKASPYHNICQEKFGTTAAAGWADRGVKPPPLQRNNNKNTARKVSIYLLYVLLWICLVSRLLGLADEMGCRWWTCM